MVVSCSLADKGLHVCGARGDDGEAFLMDANIFAPPCPRRDDWIDVGKDVPPSDEAVVVRVAGRVGVRGWFDRTSPDAR